MVVRLSTGVSRIINKLSLMSSLKLLVSEAKISKSSKLMEQSHCDRWSETADCLTFLTRFSVKLEIPICSAALVRNVGKFYHNILQIYISERNCFQSKKGKNLC